MRDEKPSRPLLGWFALHAPAAKPPASDGKPPATGGKRWTPERLAELRAFKK